METGEIPAAAEDVPTEWEPLVGRDDYDRAVARIHDWILAGDTYQVNYTYPLRATFSGDAIGWYRRLCAVQSSAHCGFIDTGRHQVLCASPELFLELDGKRVVTRPMKGTAARALSADGDRQRAADLVASQKNRAENLMIVDMARNDLGRVGETGSVCVDGLFHAERFDTVWQMTSTVSARTHAGVPEILAALFPCASVTGAPKIRTMEIIRELEPHPRGAYCGAVGWWAPGRRARFSVPIRTVIVDATNRTATYHVGSGIVSDSTAQDEFDECAAKARILSVPAPRPFELLETLRFEGEYFLLEEHLARLAASADYFGFCADLNAIRALLLSRPWAPAQPGALRIRLTVSRDGRPAVSARPLPAPQRLRVTLCPHPVDETDRFLHHKTTARDVYSGALRSCPGFDDVILWNRRGEITESTIANVVLEIDGRLVTPPVKCGLLGGVMRGGLLREGKIVEEVVLCEALSRASNLWLVNSVRKWIECAPTGL
jgi:para-aminobenzoate synthetase/4-amino-4-deoxychorismate lyase